MPGPTNVQRKIKFMAMRMPAPRIPTLLLTPVCPDCGEEIGLVRIEPAAPGPDLRTFECAGCGYSKNVDFKIRQNQADRYRLSLTAPRSI